MSKKASSTVKEKDHNKIFIIKTIHRVVFIVFNLSILYVYYCAIMNVFNIYLYTAIILILIEAIVLHFNRWECPLTDLAKRYGDERGYVADMLYPEKYMDKVFRISGWVFVFGLLLLFIRALINN